jgi:uncharacterized protein YbaP (TraB family)
MRSRALLLLALLAGCARPLPANPALWRVDGPLGAHAYLFGTIHEVPGPIAWRTAKVAAALADSDRLMVEIAGLNATATMQATFAKLAKAEQPSPIADRLPPALRPALARLIARENIDAAGLDGLKSWAAALMLAQAATPDADSRHGVDRELLSDHGTLVVEEFEGMRRQMGLFDGLPEDAQRRLLGAAVSGADGAAADSARLADAWRRGGMAAIAGQTTQGMLADPTLHRVLYAARNADWARRIAGDLAAGRHPFVAVGAAHMAGSEGLPALLGQAGYRVTRIE